MTEGSSPVRQIWMVWLSSVMSTLVICGVFSAIRTTTMKGMDLHYPDPLLRGIRWGAVVLILAFWLVGYGFARRVRKTVALEAASSPEQPPGAVAEFVPAPIRSRAVIVWVFFEAGILVSLIYWFLTRDLVSILPGFVLHGASLLYFNPSVLLSPRPERGA